MKKRFNSILGIMLVLVLCLSVIPMAAFAASTGTNAVPAAQTDEIPSDIQSDEVTDVLPPEPAEEAAAEPDEAVFEPDEAVSEPDDIDSAQETAILQPELTPVEPELLKVVDKPLVRVVYHYYDEAQNQNVTDFAGYAVSSAHSFYALAMADGAKLNIAANKYPSIVPVSADALRFRVLRGGSEDITSVAEYDAVSGLVSLPFEYMGHDITVEWYCPTSEITEVPVRVTVCTGENGRFTTTTIDQHIASDANSITIPLPVSNGLAVSQNGIELPGGMCGVKGGNLTISASALGGDISVSAYSVGIMPLGTGFSQVAHTRSSGQIFYGYYTSYYTANGNTAFCLDPTVSGLNSGSYAVSRFLQRGTGNDLLIKCAYYLYGGPGYDSIKHNLFGNPDSLETYGLCHAAASYVYLQDDDAFRGLGDATVNDLIRVLNIINAQPMPPAGFDVFIYNENNSASQSLMGWDMTPTGSLEVIKTSSNPAMSSSNSCYSLAGAIFDVYDSGNQKVGSITTDASGRGRLDGIPAGSGYYIVEVKPPTGFTGNANKYSFSIAADQTATVTVSNIPQNDPVGILLRKQDADTGTATPQGNAGLAGAEFTVKYYRGLYSSAGQLSGLTPDRTWVLRTGANGTAYLDASYLVSGDPFYYATTGDPTIPLGTVTIQETKAPVGYLLNTELFIRQITSQGTAESVRTYNAPIVRENVIRGGVSIEKWDYELNRRAVPQGDATLAGSVLEIINRSTGSVVVGGQTYAPGAVVHTMTTDAVGSAATAIDLLPYGDYEIIEKTPPTGYLNTGVIRQTFQIRANGAVIELKTSDKTIKNYVIRGGVEIEKWDHELDRRAVPQGDATLEGAVFEIWNRSAQVVLVGGMEFAPNTVVYTLTTNAEGWAGTSGDLLPYGSYEIIEKTPPTGYLNTGVISRSFAIRENGSIVNMKTNDKVIKNDVIRGGVEIEKWDIERDERTLKQGDATLEGAVFEIWNRSPGVVLVGGIEYAPDTVVHTLTTNADGWAGTEFDFLPYGSYEIIEKTPPTGYLNTGVIKQTFEIRENRVIVNLKSSDTVIKNDVIRGGVLIEKWDNEIDEHRAQGGATLEGAVFEIVNRSADSVLVEGVLYGVGEVAHTFSTDSTGTALTPDELLPYGTYEVREVSPPTGYLATGILSRTFVIREHDVIVELNTSGTAIKNDPIRGDLRGVKISDGDAARLANVPFRITSVTTGESHVVVTDVNGEFNTASTWNPHSQNTNRGETDRDGIWFGELDTLNDDLGALLFDTYRIEELPCESNRGYALLAFEVSVYRHNTIINLGTLTDDHIPVPEIFTTARDRETDTGNAAPSKTATIIDTVYYSGLTVGQEYTLRGTLMLKETGEPLLIGGQPVTAEKTFRAPSATGSVSMEFSFDSTSLAGKSVVVFEFLEQEGVEIGVHADIEDEGQTVTFKAPETPEPRIGTSAAGKNGEKELDIQPEATIIDTVSYESLTPGEIYTLKGKLMDKATGQPLLINGAEVTAEATFTPDEPAGKVEVTFTFDATALTGKTLVVFESLEHAGIEVAVHADIDDEGQTITFKEPGTPEPKIGTLAKAADGSKIVPIAEIVAVVDTVTYENLIPHQKYALKGVLMDKDTGLPLMKDGVAVTAQAEFTPASPNGSVEVRFSFDTRAIAGRTLVVFETLTLGGNEIAKHADINDAAQAVTVDAPEPVPMPAPDKPKPAKPVPQTGDDYTIILWLALAAIALPGMLVSIVFLCKKKERGRKKRKALISLILSIALLAGSAYMALGELKQYNDGAEAYAELEQFIVQPAPPDTAPGAPGHEETQTEAPEEADEQASSLLSADFTALRAINPDIMGWLICEDTPINYPIAQGKDNNRYLNRIYDGKRGKAGTPFLDYENSPDFADRNSIVYGHNMLDGSMFSCLSKYREQAYYDAHPSMFLLTPNGAYRMEVFAAFKANPNEAGTDTSPWRQKWDAGSEFAAWLVQIKGRSLVQTDVELAEDDHILTLSTCISRGRDRFLVMGRLTPAE